MVYLAIILPIAFVGIAFLMWFTYGRDERAVETVEFYPPEGYNSAEIGFLYRGKAVIMDVVSLLLYLANKGYMAISESEEKTFIMNQKGLRITKIKEYDGNNSNEKLFLDGIFKEKPEVTFNDLRDNFYTTLNTILNNLNNRKNREIIFEKSSLNKTVFIVLMIAAIFVLITVKPVTEFHGAGMIPYGVSSLTTDIGSALFIGLLWPGIGFSIFLGILTGAIILPGGHTVSVSLGSYSSSKYVFKTPKWMALVFSGPFGGIPWAIVVLPALLRDPGYLLAYITGLVCITVILLFAKYMTKRTAYGNEILGKIQGFKNFLETTEKHKLEALITQNPAYFHNILPFTYVLGISDKWINFNSISLKPPDWYSNTRTFDSAAFGDFVNQTMATATSVMSSGGDGRPL